MAQRQPAPRPVVIAELTDTELCHFIRKIRTSKKTHNNDLSNLITSMWDFARVLNVEEHLRWQKYGAFMENRFGIKLEEWQSLTRRLVIALDAGLEAFDAVRKAHKEATKDSEPLPEKMVKTVPRDWMKLYQKAWVLLGLAQKAQAGSPRRIPAYCTLIEFDTFEDRFAVIEQALLHNKLLTRTVFNDIDWMYRIAAHPMLEDAVDGAGKDEQTETDDDAYLREVEALNKSVMEQLWGPSCATSGAC